MAKELLSIEGVFQCHIDENEYESLVKVFDLSGLENLGTIIWDILFEPFTDDVKEAVSGQECGLSVKDFNDIQVGDIIEGYEQLEVKAKL